MFFFFLLLTTNYQQSTGTKEILTSTDERIAMVVFVNRRVKSVLYIFNDYLFDCVLMLCHWSL